MTGSVETIPAAQFRDQCLRLMDEVNATGRELVVTKHGRPVVAVVPVMRQGAPSVIGWCPDILIHDDLSEPAVPARRWHIVSDPERTLTGISGNDEQ